MYSCKDFLPFCGVNQFCVTVDKLLAFCSFFTYKVEQNNICLLE
jgi:hypothetical protein